MGSGTFFSKLAGNPLFQSLDLPGSHKYEDTLPVQVGPNSGPYAGASLAGANAGYAAGGPGSEPGVGGAPTVYGAAGQGHGSPGGIFGFQNKVFSPFSMYTPAASAIGNAASGVVNGASAAPTQGGMGVPNYSSNPYAAAAANATMTSKGG
jgi:hypothetical protein